MQLKFPPQLTKGNAHTTKAKVEKANYFAALAGGGGAGDGRRL